MPQNMDHSSLSSRRQNHATTELKGTSAAEDPTVQRLDEARKSMPSELSKYFEYSQMLEKQSPQRNMLSIEKKQKYKDTIKANIISGLKERRKSKHRSYVQMKSGEKYRKVQATTKSLEAF